MSHLQIFLNWTCGHPAVQVASLNMPYSMSLWMWPESIWQMWSSHMRCLWLRIVNKLRMPVCLRTSVLATLSCQEIWRMCLRQQRWKLLSIFSWLAYVLQISLPYRSVLNTQAWYACYLVFPVRWLLLYTLLFSLVMTDTALAILLFTSASEDSELEIVYLR